MTDASAPIRIGQRTLKNRITMAPTVKFYAGDDGLVTDEYVRHYEERAAGGCGLIVVEATCISREGRLFPSQLGLWNDEQIEGHRRLADAVHRQGALVIPQIHHGGLGTHPACGPMTSPTKVLWNNGKDEAWAKELAAEEIRAIVKQFIDAAVRARRAGYDGVQLHACHGYLINDFASSVNRRTDEYGGSPENRARFGCEIISGIRSACGPDFIISSRVSGCDPTPEEAILIAERYAEAGCDYLQVSNGIAPLDGIPHDESLPYNKVAALGVRLHEHFRGRVPVSVVNGLNTPEQIRYLFEHDLTDTVDLARAVLADPAFPQAVLSGAPYVKCSGCPDCAFGPGHRHPCPAMIRRGVDPSVRF